MSDCLFCKIVAGEIPAEPVYRDDLVLAIPDVNPQAPLHLLVMPVRHAADVAQLAEGEEDATIAAVFSTAALLGSRHAPGGFRLVANTGNDGGQTVGHFHVHVIGGRRMEWPPG
ncbi:MAG: HIT domain-containing protein [Vulcanimicrobiaceae bacterium]